MKNQTIDLQELDAYLTGRWITDLSNFSAYIFQNFKGLNWAGFYLSDGKKLILGPFNGKPACMEIAFGRGVCGTAFSNRAPQLVDDVHAFKDHIVCDSNSKSELVLPFYIGNNLVGVFDMDSPDLARFSNEDLKIIEGALQVLSKKLPDFNPLEVLNNSAQEKAL